MHSLFAWPAGVERCEAARPLAARAIELCNREQRDHGQTSLCTMQIFPATCSGAADNRTVRYRTRNKWTDMTGALRLARRIRVAPLAAHGRRAATRRSARPLRVVLRVESLLTKALLYG